MLALEQVVFRLTALRKLGRVFRIEVPRVPRDIDDAGFVHCLEPESCQSRLRQTLSKVVGHHNLEPGEGNRRDEGSRPFELNQPVLRQAEVAGHTVAENVTVVAPR